MEHLRTILILCEIFAVIMALSYAGRILIALWRALRRKEADWESLHIFKKLEANAKENGLKAFLLPAAVIVGLGYMVLSNACETTEIGAFFEKRGEYEEQYEATVYIESKPIFCIVDVRKIVDRELKYKGYRIVSLQLPYGKVEDDVDAEYNSNATNSVLLGGDWVNCEIVIGSVATEASYERLENTVVTAYGDLCGSRAGDTYHYCWCPSAQSISNKNRVFFESEKEATALCYRPCGLCLDY